VKPSGWLAVVAGAVVAGLFAFANRFERVNLNLGLTSIYAIPLAIVIFAAFLLGMAAMLLVSLPQDRRIREQLRAHNLLNAPTPPPLPGSAVPGPPDYAPIPTPHDERDAAGS